MTHFYTPHGLKIRLKPDNFNPVTFPTVSITVETVFLLRYLLDSVLFLYLALYTEYYGYVNVTQVLIISVGIIIVNQCSIHFQPSILIKLLVFVSPLLNIAPYVCYLIGIVFFIRNSMWLYLMYAVIAVIVTKIVSSRIKHFVMSLRGMPGYCQDTEYYAVICELHYNQISTSLSEMFDKLSC